MGNQQVEQLLYRTHITWWRHVPLDSDSAHAIKWVPGKLSDNLKATVADILQAHNAVVRYNKKNGVTELWMPMAGYEGSFASECSLSQYAGAPVRGLPALDVQQKMSDEAIAKQARLTVFGGGFNAWDPHAYVLQLVGKGDKPFRAAARNIAHTADAGLKIKAHGNKEDRDAVRGMQLMKLTPHDPPEKVNDKKGITDIVVHAHAFRHWLLNQVRRHGSEEEQASLNPAVIERVQGSFADPKNWTLEVPRRDRGDGFFQLGQALKERSGGRLHVVDSSERVALAKFDLREHYGPGEHTRWPSLDAATAECIAGVDYLMRLGVVGNTNHFSNNGPGSGNARIYHDMPLDEFDQCLGPQISGLQR